jgi:predicted amidohydrolase
VSGSTVRAAVVQLLADDDTAANIARAGELVQAAAVSGAQLVVLPEKWNWWGPASRTADGAEGLDGPSLTAARAWARELGVALVAGSILEATGNGVRAFNTSVAIAPDGRDVAVYRKVHLFDVTVEGRDYRESHAVQAGDALACANLAGLRVGLSVCYDLRFPELYRSLGQPDLILVPAAFTATTGRAHWLTLLRARAIENLCYVLAPAQGGRHVNGRATFGHSVLFDPWGETLAQIDQGPGVIVGDVDLDRIAQVRASLPALAHRVFA